MYDSKMLKDPKTAEMEKVLNDITLGIISTEEVIEWLKTAESEVPDLKSVENFEFVPYFLNFVKSSCAWLCQTEKTLESPKNKNDRPATHGDNLKDSTSVQKYNVTPVKDEGQNRTPVKTNQFNYQHKPNRENFNQNMNKPQTFTLGCTPYKHKGNFINTRFIQNSPGINNKDIFPHVGYNGKQSTQFSERNNSPVNSNFNRKPNNNRFYENANSFNGKHNNAQNFNNFEAFPPLGSKIEDNKARRRITPTPVVATNSFNSKFGKSHFSPIQDKIPNEVFKNPTFQDSSSDLQQERNLLKATKNVLQIVSNATPTKPEVSTIETKTPEKEPQDPIVCPDPEKISRMEHIMRVSEIYCFLVHNALVQNVTSEIYFLFELITSKRSPPSDSKNGLFDSIHNCIYFAVTVLGKECSLLHMLDKATLKSMEKVPYLLKFSPQLIDFLGLCSLLKQDVAPVLPSLTAVPFQIEVDSRSNFPDEYSFICFKRQRDLFYEMLREWQESMECVDNKFHGNFLRKAKQLITLGPNSVNMFHLARLFQSQLVASCMGLEVNEIFDELLNDIQRNFPDKFKKLQERFLTPSNVGGLTPPPSFYGIQSFFAELITAAGSPSLNQHLTNVFVCKILELNGTDIFSDTELSSLGTVRDKYVFLLHTLRLLGKFLGYIYFLPYPKEEISPVHIVEQQLASRQFTPPAVNLPLLLKESAGHGHIVLTVPWIVEFLSFVDSVGKKLKDIQEALNILAAIYRSNCLLNYNVQSHLFLRVIIGWLFGVLNYPNNFYVLTKPIDLNFDVLNNGVDSLAVIDKQLIHSCCPFLIEFKVLIYNFVNGITDKKREVRKITPLSTVSVKSVKSPVLSMHQLEHRLEEHFFFLQPASVKKITEFIAERMASKVINTIRNDVTSMKLNLVELITKDEKIKEIANEADQDFKRKSIDELLDKKTKEGCDDIHRKISISIENTKSEIHKIVPTLLSEDTKDAIADKCCKISFRLSVDKILEWCKANFLMDAIKNDIRNKVQHISKSEINMEPPLQLNASYWIGVFRSTIVKIHSQTYEFDLENIQTLCTKMAAMVSDKISEAMKKIIVLLSVDLCIGLIVHYPKNCSETVFQYFDQFWVNCPKSIFTIKLLLCAQNLKFLWTGQDIQLCQRKFAVLLNGLIVSKQISDEDIDSFIKEWKECENLDFKYLNFLEKYLKQSLIK